MFGSIIAIIAVLTAISFAGEPPLIVTFWDGRVIDGELIDFGEDHLTLHRDVYEWRIEKVDIASIRQGKIDLTNDYLTREEIGRAALQAVTLGHKVKIGLLPIAEADKPRNVLLLGTSGDKFDGKIRAHNDTTITLRRWGSDRIYRMEQIYRITQGRTDVSPTYLNDAQLLRLLSTHEGEDTVKFSLENFALTLFFITLVVGPTFFSTYISPF